MEKGISKNSVFISIDDKDKTVHPEMTSKYFSNGSPTQNMVIDVDSVCRLYVENWNTYQDKLPNGFVTDQAIADILMPAPLSVVSIGNPYIRFLVQSISPTFQEAVTPMVNLMEGFTTYSFGSEPAMVQIAGVLVHTEKDNWSELFLALYTNFLKASKLAALSVLNNKRYQVVLQYQGKIMKGSILSFAKSTNANNEQAVGFNMGFLLKELSFKWVEQPASSVYNYTTTTFKVGDKFSINRVSTASPTGSNINLVGQNPATSNR